MIKRLCELGHIKQPIDERCLSLIDINVVYYVLKKALIAIIYGIIDASSS